MPSKPDRNSFPKFYPILDAGLLSVRAWDMAAFARELRAAGIELLQYRDKQGSDEQVLQSAAVLREIFADTRTSLILNDRAGLLSQSKFDGVHVGQQDLAPASVRGLVGQQAIVGVSTHTMQQVAIADATDCDYVAYGPIFATASKANPDPVVGLDGLRAARRATKKPLVAIGGITRSNGRAVIDVGADSIAVISELLPQPGPIDASTVRQIAEEFLALLMI
ncbi:MAG TPA: thiamine phosphate synthase [Acidobacteriaceae bacterium]|jgi:thiamine-phosphate pyrophosphorylase|nr:thiamine phosphate synthase [Acidobacteriaceae bacterium]